jgi:hypothetical protein
MVIHYSNGGNGEPEGNSIKRSIWAKLTENPLLSPKELAKLLDLPYKQYRNYITKERSNWKYYHESERGSKCSGFHCYKAKVRLDRGLSDDLKAKLSFGVPNAFVGYGWRLSRARNKFLIWKGRFGRVVWYTTGLVLLEVKKPGNLGKAKQLFCDAFCNSGLLTDFKVLNPVLERLGPKSCHFPYETPMRLPYVQINDFAESHGIIIKVGDRSHPNAIEVIAEFTSKQAEIEQKVTYVFDAFQRVDVSRGLVDPKLESVKPPVRGLYE